MTMMMAGVMLMMALQGTPVVPPSGTQTPVLDDRQAAPAAGAPEKAPAVPAVPEDAKKALAALQQRALGLEDAKGLLQKEIDAITAEFNRVIARLQAAAPAGYELAPDLSYVKKKSS